MGGLFLGRGDDGCGLEAGGDSALDEGEVEDGGVNICQFVGTCSESPYRDVGRLCCLAGVDPLQGFEYLD